MNESQPNLSAKRDKITSVEGTIAHSPHVHQIEHQTYNERSTEKGGEKNTDETNHQEIVEKQRKMYEIILMRKYDPDMNNEEKRLACSTVGESKYQLENETDQQCMGLEE